MKKKLSKGFTLIELLVVIAIIGVLSSIVMASLGSTRNRSADASTKAQLAALRGQASLYFNLTGNGAYMVGGQPAHCSYTTSGTLNGVFGTCTGLILDATIANQLKAVAKNSGYDAYMDFNSTTWAAWTQLKAGGVWCVDSSGASEYQATAPSPTNPNPITACP